MVLANERGWREESESRRRTRRAVAQSSPAHRQHSHLGSLLSLSYPRSAAPTVLQFIIPLSVIFTRSGSTKKAASPRLASPRPRLFRSPAPIASALACYQPAPQRGTPRETCLHRSSCSLLLLLRRRHGWESLLPPVVQLCRPHPRLLAQFSLAVRQGEKPATTRHPAPGQRAGPPCKQRVNENAPGSRHPEEQVVLRYRFPALGRLPALNKVALNYLGTNAHMSPRTNGADWTETRTHPGHLGWDRELRVLHRGDVAPELVKLARIRPHRLSRRGGSNVNDAISLE